MSLGGAGNEAVRWRRELCRFIEREAKPVEKFGHQPRLYRLTQEIVEALPPESAYDDDVVFAAAWLHDLGVFQGHRPEEPGALEAWDNVAYAIEKTPEVLTRFGFPDKKIPAVVEAIRTHQASAVPLSPESAILRDADILEQLGAVGILRAICKVGRDTRYATFSDAMPVLRTALEQLPGQLTYPRARELARSRIAVLQAFLDGVDRETRGDLF